MDWRRVTGRFLLVAVVLVGLVALLGVRDVVRILGDVHPVRYALAPLSSVVALLVWAVPLRWFTRHADGVQRGWRFLGGYFTGILLRDVIPGGQSGESALVAYGLTRRTTAEFERVLAATVTTDLLRYVTSLTTGAAGLAVVLWTRGATPETLRPAAALAATTLLFLLVGAAVFRRPDLLKRLVFAVAAALRRTVGRVWPAAEAALSRSAVEERLAGFADTWRDIAADRGTLLAGALVTQLGWVFAVLPLSISLWALGVPQPLSLAFLVVPAAGFAAFVPLPGGTGGVEVALAGMLSLLTGLDVTTVGAVVLLYRLSTYWTALGSSALFAAALAPGPAVPEDAMQLGGS